MTLKRYHSGIILTGLFSLFLFLAGACGGGSPRENGGGGDASELTYSQCISGKITTWGEAPIYTSKDASRLKAKENACRKAVEKCIGAVVAKRSGVKDGRSIGTEIYSESKGICKNDSIVDEKTYKLDTINMLKVFVTFKVDEVKINNAIDAAQKLAGNPKVMVLIREEHDLGVRKKTYRFTDPSGVAGAEIRNMLSAKGYQIIPSEKARPSSSEENALDNPSTLDETLAALKNRAAKAGADVLVIGQLDVQPQDVSTLRGTDFKSMRASGTLRMITLWGRGKEMGSYTKSAPGAALRLDEAGRVAAKKYVTNKSMKKFLFKKLQDEWRNITLQNEIIVKIKGMSDRAAGSLRDDLVTRTAVKRVNEQDRNSTLATWEVIYPGRAFALADTIAYYGANPSMFNVVKLTCKKLNVDSVRRGEINLSFQNLPTKSAYRCLPADKL